MWKKIQLLYKHKQKLRNMLICNRLFVEIRFLKNQTNLSSTKLWKHKKNLMSFYDTKYLPKFFYSNYKLTLWLIISTLSTFFIKCNIFFVYLNVIPKRKLEGHQFQFFASLSPLGSLWSFFVALKFISGCTTHPHF